MDLKFLKELSRKFPDLPLYYDVSWSEITSLGSGQKIPLLAEPSDDICLSDLLAFCSERGVKVLVIGEGCNTVGSDKTLDFMFVKLRQNDFVRTHFGRKHVTVGAGVRLSDFVRSCAAKGFYQFNHLAGIPGSIGGALRLNAGAFETEIGSFVTEMFGFDMNGEAWSIAGRDIQWDYRECSIPMGLIITGAIFKLVAGLGGEGDLSRTLEKRKDRYPIGHSAGCVFKNPDPETPAGMLIEKCGLKGRDKNFMKISEKHANWIIRQRHSAKTADFVELAKSVKKKVFDKYNIILKPEVCFADPEDFNSLKKCVEPLKICVLSGGLSSEREVSLESGAAVAEALRRAGHKVEQIDVKEPLITDTMRKCDLVFPVLHGGFGEDGSLQRLLEAENLNFVGCSGSASELLMDKVATKKLLELINLDTPRWFLINSTEENTIPDDFKFPLVVKNPREGSSMGLYIVNNSAEYNNAAATCLEAGPPVLVEEYIEGIEVTVGVIGGEALPVVEIVPPDGGFYDYDAKYTHEKGETLYLCPPKSIDSELQKQVQQAALEFCMVAEATALARVDFIVDKKSKQFFILEGNSIPGFTASSLVPKAAAEAGFSFTMLCAKLAKLNIA